MKYDYSVLTSFVFHRPTMSQEQPMTPFLLSLTVPQTGMTISFSDSLLYSIDQQCPKNSPWFLPSHRESNTDGTVVATIIVWVQHVSSWRVPIYSNINHLRMSSDSELAISSPARGLFMWRTSLPLPIKLLNGKDMLAVVLWRELQGVLIDCIPYCFCLSSNTPNMPSYHPSFHVQPGTPHLGWQSDTRTTTKKGTCYPIPPCQIWITNPSRFLQHGYSISTPASSSLDYSTTQERL